MNKKRRFGLVLGVLLLVIAVLLIFRLSSLKRESAISEGVKITVSPLPKYQLEDGTSEHLSLCWIEHGIGNQQIPSPQEFYFTAYDRPDGKIYMTDSLGTTPTLWLDLNQYSPEPLSLQNCVVAVSPKHNSVLAAEFDVAPGNGLIVCEQDTTIHLNFENPLQGWLYNSGIDFVYDETGKEYCLFAEYSHERKNTRRVLKGTYPYANPDNWKVVFEYPSARGADEAIFHFHHIRKDPYSDIIYLTSGDNAEESKFFYSNDLGETWNLLVSHQYTGYLRCCNMIFLEDKIYWASDDYHGHFLMSAERSQDGLLDVKTIKRVADLPRYQATNALAYLSYANALFFYDRLPSAQLCKRNGWEEELPLDVYLYDLDEDMLIPLLQLDPLGVAEDDAFGHRGRAYLHYASSPSSYPILGFCRKYVPCSFNLPENQEHQLGSLGYRIEF